jgi:hypothetical protein
LKKSITKMVALHKASAAALRIHSLLSLNGPKSARDGLVTNYTNLSQKPHGRVKRSRESRTPIRFTARLSSPPAPNARLPRPRTNYQGGMSV